MNTKNQRREAAQKKAKKRRVTILALCALLVVAAITTIVVYTVTRPGVRIFEVAGTQSVRLYDNGDFTARLAHNVNLSGTFTEEVTGNVSAISFMQGGNVISTQIEDNVLLLPNDWLIACRTHNHETELPLRR